MFNSVLLFSLITLAALLAFGVLLCVLVPALDVLARKVTRYLERKFL